MLINLIDKTTIIIDMSKPRMCSDCKGYGHIKTIVTEQTCFHCLGHGQILIFGSSKTCDKCNGRGKVQTPPIVLISVCNRCNGKGTITY